MSHHLTKRYRRLASRGGSHIGLLIFLVICFGLLAAVALNRQYFFDWYRLHNYDAPVAVSQLATQDTMKPYARKVFYVNHPAIAAKTDFSKSCPNNGGEQTIVLGCYHSDQAGIYVLNVDDNRLTGVEQVTAAHETLHAIYDRLSSSERSHVNAMLLDYYHNDLHDQRLLTTINAYKKTEPNDVVNEMHSVFGTEVAKLPANLEQYYSQYFTNRGQIAAYAAQYQAEFTSRQALVAQDDAQLAALKSRIDSGEADLKTKQSAIASQRNSLNSERSSGDITGYNAGVPVYNNAIDTYNTEVQTTQSLIDQYNQLVNSRNKIAFEEDQLANDLNANAQTIQN